jgi:hypothetical protein
MQGIISFTDVIQGLVDDVFKSVDASKTGLNACQDLYHFQMAVNEHGEEAVVQETTRVLKERYRYSYAEASVDAGNRVRAALELVKGQDTFQTVRTNLNKK